ncbi:carboxylesterase/lipase family protein [Herbiconiux sp. L3-i23]|uniref:carboxylesterase/lipase family protein n=1 Tax=Herbiconiux sp. L3-i23 TaxID=2905871 RepID=UPI00206AC91A|nr:carboxylesterase/lipase family protein [Herbiconiux sp. L3-i23]BDI22535.1 carboxylic ester hydrolase [Herbiconiux sp. L3-i23]
MTDAITSPAGLTPDEGERVEAAASAGTFIGRRDGSVAVWKGIRYAEAPVGPLRWRAPRPAPAAAEPVTALAFGNASPQELVPEMHLGEGVALSEDCLFLNVWSPSASLPSNSDPAPARPVMVWIHGGAYTYGAASQPVYDGAALASIGDVVIVTVNYRLGALGYLDLTSFATDTEQFDSNLALRDVLLALEWVRDNIAAFGGDPDAVTVFGESAGAGMITALLATPSAEGLFHRAIAESSPASSMYGPARSKLVAEHFLAEARMGEGPIGEVRSMPVSAIVEAATRVYSSVPSESPGLLAFAPVVDGDLLPEHPITVLHQGRGLPVPLIIGTNHDEATLFKFMKSPLMPITPAAITTMMQRLASENPDAVLPSREQLLGAYEGVRSRAVGLGIARDIGFRMPTVWLVEGHSTIAPTYLYRFDWATPMLRLIGMAAAHATELPYVWGNLDSNRRDYTFALGGRRTGEEISDRMTQWWTSFAATGTPGSEWPSYDADRASLVIDRTDRVEHDLDAGLRKGWGDAVLSFT